MISDETIFFLKISIKIISEKEEEEETVIIQFV